MLNLYEQPLEPLKGPKNAVVQEFIKQLQQQEFSINGIQAAISETKNVTKASGKNLFLPIRLAATNSEHGPELAKAIFLFGKEKIYQRLGVSQDANSL